MILILLLLELLVLLILLRNKLGLLFVIFPVPMSFVVPPALRITIVARDILC